MARTGKVYRVSAGPGHPELLPITAAELVKIGDLMLCDQLIQGEVRAVLHKNSLSCITF
jgi:siroheme synthase